MRIASANQKSQPVMHRICVSIILLFSLTAANAADIDVKRLENRSMLIVIEGDFDLDDVETFRSNVAPVATAPSDRGIPQ